MGEDDRRLKTALRPVIAHKVFKRFIPAKDYSNLQRQADKIIMDGLLKGEQHYFGLLNVVRTHFGNVVCV